MAADLAALSEPRWPLDGWAKRAGDDETAFLARPATRSAEALFVEAWRVERGMRLSTARALEEQFNVGESEVVSESFAEV